MNIVDIILIVFILLGALNGFIRGFLKETMLFVGTILVIVLSFVFKNTLSEIMYNNLPFFKFAGLSSLNIIVYEVIAFLLSVVILSIVLAIVVKVTGIIEKILKSTVILAIPSKLLGMVVGVIKSIVISYVILFVLSLPVLKLNVINESIYAQLILNSTPVMSDVTNDIKTTFDEIRVSTKNSINLKDIKGTNTSIIEILLKNKIVTSDSIKLLIDKGKIEINNSEELLDKYKED